MSISLVPKRDGHTVAAPVALVFSCGKLATEAARDLAFGDERAAVPAVLRNWVREQTHDDAYPVRRAGSSVSGFVISLDDVRLRICEKNGRLGGYERSVTTIDLAGCSTNVYVYTKAGTA